MTSSERKLWERIRKRQLGFRVHRQKVILGWIADFWIPAINLVIEVDGLYHKHRFAQDALRDRVMQQKGFRVLRVTNEEIEHDLDAVVGRIQ